jgi:4a-hydroxytetrahydrobiopterin dehydratase
MPRLLTVTEIRNRLRKLDGWKLKGKFIEKTFEFESFVDGIRFIDEVAEVAEKEQHHPDIHVRYTAITLSIQTHSKGGVTSWDIGLAAEIDRALEKSSK